MWYALIAVVAVLALAGTAILVLVTRDDGDDPEPPSTTTTEAEPDVEPILLQNVDEAGPDPFSPSFASDTLPALAAAAVEAAREVRDGFGSAAGGALAAEGSTPGLYGGSRDDQVCDAEGIADFLDGEPEKAEAFADALGIDVGSIRDRLIGYTPVVLASDTWVTNHGFADGEASPFPAILQAGTAVLVDELGVPRVRCSCGNPLAEPPVDDHRTDVTEGEAWDDFAPEEVTVVEQGEELEVVTLIDVETGETFDRLLGSGRTGDVQVTLRWTGSADLDLHVTDPLGEEIYFADRDGENGGELDVDVIPGCGEEPAAHAENVFFAAGEAPSGTYEVVVDSYTGCDGQGQDFELQVVVDGEVVVSEAGSVPADGEAGPFTFER